MERGKRTARRLLIGLLALVLLSSGALAHISGGPRELLDALVSLDPRVFLLSFSLLLLAEIVKAWRLSYIAWRTGTPVPLTHSIIARFSGRLIGVLTPAYTGATPTRSIILSAYTRHQPGVMFGLATIESLLDTIVSVLVALAFSIPLLPESWLVVLVSTCLLLSWLGGVVLAVSERMDRILDRLPLPENARCYLKRQRRLFVEGLRNASRMRILGPGLLLTLVSHVVEAVGLLVVLAGAPPEGWGPGLVLKAFILMEATYVLSMSITPGGALFFEYGLAGLMTPEKLVAWRVVYLLFSILPGAVIVVTIRPVRRYIREALEREVGECGEDI